MNIVAAYSGTFDPITLGHNDIIHRAARMFPKLIVAVGRRPNTDGLGVEDAGGNYIPCDIFLRGRGKSMFTPDHRLGFEPEDMEAWFAYWQSMREAGAVPPGDVQALSGSDDPSTAGIVAGRTAMAITLTDSFVGFQSLSQDPLVLHMMPNGFEGGEMKQRHYSYAGNSTSVSAKSPYHEQIIDIIHFMHFDPEGSRVFYEGSGMIPASKTLRDQLADERSVTPVLDALTRAAPGLTDRYRVPAGPMPRGEHRLPPPVNTVEVPFRDWVMARIETSLAPRLLSSTRDVALKVEPLSNALSELERRVAFNVELAVNELSVVEGEEVPKQTRRLVRDMIGSALERNRELFEGYADDSERWGDEVRRSVRDAVLSSLDELRGGLVDGEVGRMSSQMKRDVRGRRLVRWARQSRRAISRSWAIAGRAVREAIGEARLDRARQRVGLPPHTSEAEIVPQGFAPPEPAPSIPMVYRRLFSAQALEAGDILTGRDDALQRAISLLEDGPAGSLRTVAVVGPDGVGKSAFVNAVIRAKRWPKVRELALEGPATLEQVDALFEPSGEGHLVVVSGVHWLRALQPGGFSALRRFVDRVIQDGGKNAFLVRADTLVWEQSLEAAPLRDAFPDLITLGPLEPEALQAAVLARHTVSGYGLVFSQGIQPESRLEELVMQASSPLSRPQQSFFRALHAASGGLLRDALRLWLASVEEVDEAGDFVHLGPVPTSSLYALRRLGEREVLTLYQVARQGWMDASVCASLFRIDETTARARLMALGHVGILERRGAVWRIALHLRGTVQRLLREKGFIA